MKLIMRLSLFIALTLFLSACGDTLAESWGLEPQITNGELDGDNHPYVGLMYFETPTSIFRCSGTLLSPTLFLTAGHCTQEAGVQNLANWVSFDSEIIFPDDLDLFDDAAFKAYLDANFISGEAFSHPQYDDAAFYLYDLGVVVLDEPVFMDEYGELPEQDVLDRMARRRGKQNTSFTAVGYGLQRINPVFVEAERVRMVARPRLIQINTPGFTGDYSILLSNNHATGGTCFGDSGGPNFIGDSRTIGGVTSFGKNGNCAGTGGVYRVDRADDLNWLYGEFGNLLD